MIIYYEKDPDFFAIQGSTICVGQDDDTVSIRTGSLKLTPGEAHELAAAITAAAEGAEHFARFQNSRIVPRRPPS